jgi:hypothetical protein
MKQSVAGKIKQLLASSKVETEILSEFKNSAFRTEELFPNESSGKFCRRIPLERIQILKSASQRPE